MVRVIYPDVPLDAELEDELLLADLAAELDAADAGTRQFRRGDMVRLRDKDQRVCIVTGPCPGPNKVHVKFWRDGKKQSQAYDITRLELVVPSPLRSAAA